MIEIFFVFVLLATLALAVFAYRNNLTFKWRMRRIEEIHAHAKQLIAAGDWDGALLAFRLYSDIGSYGSTLWNLRAWTYRQAFPNRLGAA